MYHSDALGFTTFNSGRLGAQGKEISWILLSFGFGTTPLRYFSSVHFPSFFFSHLLIAQSYFRHSLNEVAAHQDDRYQTE
jgi:hypothetical protein